MLNELRRSFRPSILRCLLFGHDDTLAREPKRLFLRCDLCGRQTRGWTIGPPPGTAERLVSSRNMTSRRPRRLGTEVTARG
jgi:hypothetical protein